MLKVRLTNILMVDTPCSEPLFILALLNLFLRKGFSDKTCDANPIMWEYLLWRIKSHLLKWEKGFEVWFFKENDAWVLLVFCIFEKWVMMHDFDERKDFFCLYFEK